MWGFINLLGRFVDVPSLAVKLQILGLDREGSHASREATALEQLTD